MLDPLVKRFLDTAHLRLDGLHQIRVVRQHTELDVPVFSAPREIGAGHQQEPVIDREKLRMVAHGRAIELSRSQHDAGM